jgi:uncharacterized protein YjaZ
MKAHFVRTDDIYGEIIAAPDDRERKRIYLEQLVQPWQQMMAMVGGMWGSDSADELAGPRAWNWLLPEDLTSEPEILKKMKDANAWQLAKEALEKGVRSFEPYADRIPFETIEGWLVLADAEKADPIGRGYTGGIDFFQPRFICQYDTLTEANLRSLPGCVVHEFNHLVRLKAFPWDMQNTSVADYIVHEGLAESFAAELFGEAVVGYYVTDFDESQLHTANSLIMDGLDKTGFDVIRAYIFGDHWAEKLNLPKTGMPAYGGYAIGYHVVQAFLQRSGCSAAEATFIPANHIVRESGWDTHITAN